VTVKADNEQKRLDQHSKVKIPKGKYKCKAVEDIKCKVDSEKKVVERLRRSVDKKKSK